MQVFDEWMPTPNQLASKPATKARVTESDLLAVPSGRITYEGFFRNIEISLIYLESWLRGIGCVPIFNLMEDAATAEISAYCLRDSDGNRRCKSLRKHRQRDNLVAAHRPHQNIAGNHTHDRANHERAKNRVVNWTGP